MKIKVLVLSIMRQLMGITRDDGKQKPAIIKLYEFTKGGTDVMDQKISKYSCKSLTHRWTMIHFFNLMNTIRCNAMVLHAIKHKKPLRKSNSFDIGWELLLALVRTFMAERQTVGLGQALTNKVAIFVQKNSDEPAPRSADGDSRYSERKQRCISEISGPDHRKRKDNLKKLKSCFEECGNPVCEEHSKLICHNHSE